MEIFASILWIIFSFLMIVSGILGLFTPFEVLLSFSFFLPIALIIGGVSGIFYYFSNKEYPWASLLLMDAIFNLLFAVIFIAGGVEFTSEVVIYFVAFMVLFRGVLGCSYAFTLHRERVQHWIWMLLLSIVNIIISALFIIYPTLAGLTIGIMISLLVLLFGLVCLISWFSFRRLA